MDFRTPLLFSAILTAASSVVISFTPSAVGQAAAWIERFPAARPHDLGLGPSPLADQP